MFYKISEIALMSGSSVSSIGKLIKAGKIEEKYIKESSPLQLHVDIVPILRASNNKRKILTLNELAEFVHSHLGGISNETGFALEDVYENFTKKIMSEIGQN